MGVDLKPLADIRKIDMQELKGSIVAVDAFNTLHQFLSIIRQRDGTPLKDSMGRVTSHLSGILYRTANLVENGIKPVYVFDGKPHPLKMHTIQRRNEIRKEAEKEWKEAVKRGDMEEAFKKAQRSSRINEEIVKEAKALLGILGIPYIQAPGEGEAQAAYMASRGDVDAVASQDFDSLLFGSPVLVRNLAVTGKRKLPDKHIWVNVHVEKIELGRLLETHGITREQLVDIAILIGTDFNEGIKGIGPKKALVLIKKYGKIENIPELAIEGYDEVRKIFLEPDVTGDYTMEWKEVDEEELIKFMCDEHDFSVDRVRHAAEKYRKFAKSFKQKNLFDFG
ncbi:MAG: flap endonuclease-1 [Thermoplasmata archaeon]|nr:flap endonuclease-1 [Thermoplasmata archaeon]